MSKRYVLPGDVVIATTESVIYSIGDEQATLLKPQDPCLLIALNCGKIKQRKFVGFMFICDPCVVLHHGKLCLVPRYNMRAIVFTNRNSFIRSKRW
jgi:hypothetical protein